ncbi:outer membrane beta-barrel protein [Desertifilum sp. FACHB-1129]|nr:outer membrane beta-barrel protein [Desertifilum sp. FACHB-868]MBD2311811.1 outer membrane beta-barrel protein [Desertifilum sp. FACHB-1129]MDA0209157.1 outer membrane beta-barrel protein [Cyanobacteria bacterium FC1]
MVWLVGDRPMLAATCDSPVTIAWEVVPLLASSEDALLTKRDFVGISHSAIDLHPTFTLQAQQPSLDFPLDAPLQPIDPLDIEAELGDIEILPSPLDLVPPQVPTLELLLRSSTFNSSNVFAREDARSDLVFVNSLLLVATPQLGPQTRLVAGIEGGLVRFANEGEMNYNLVRFTAGIQQQLASRMYGQLSWVQDRVYQADDGDRFLLQDTARLLIGRQDPLSEQWRLDSFYELSASFASPSSRNQIMNALGVRFRREITSDLEGTLDYRLSLEDYTKTNRFDIKHQVGAALYYNISPRFLIGGSVSYLFGSSSRAAVDVNNFSIGVNLGVNLPLF